MQRRYFLVNSLAATHAVSRAAPASDQVNVAVIGVRGRGRNLARELSEVPGVRFAYLCDVDPAVFEAALKHARANGSQPKLVSDMRRVFDDPSVDAVFIATPDHWHAPAAILACDAGKDVYVEKPASHNLRESRLMVEAARRNRRIVQLGTQARSRPSTIRGIEYARSGKIGRVLMAKAWNVQLRDNIGRAADSAPPAGVDYDTWVGPAPFLPFRSNRFHYNWHWHWNFGTGDIGNDGAHQLDIARWALDAGYPTHAAGMAAKLFFDDDQQTPDTMNIQYAFPGGKMIVFEMRIWNPYEMHGMSNAVSVYGTGGEVRIERGFEVYDAKGKLVHEEKGGPDHHPANFIECVRSRKPPNAEIETGHISCTLCQLGNVVARTGRAVRFDAATETIPGDEEANRLLSREYRRHWAAPKGV